jgi:cation diffusion facilitator family transporter
MRSYERFRLHVSVADEDEGPSIVGVAFIADVLVAIAKTVAAMLTGSSSLRTEAVHSWVDVGNEGFVVAAARTARKPADEAHPMGYGRASYVWSMFASIVTLAAGAVVGVWQGVQQLSEPDRAAHYIVGYCVIAVSFVLEGVSFVQTLRQLRKGANELGRDLLEHALVTSNSPVRAVFAEDLTALIALVAATLGMLLHQLTGAAIYDAIGSIVIGLVMAVAALLLIMQNARFLAGKSLDLTHREDVTSLIRKYPDVARVTFVYTEFIGPELFLVLAGVGIAGDHDQAELATILRALERELMQQKYIGLAIMTLATAEDDDLDQHRQ